MYRVMDIFKKKKTELTKPVSKMSAAISEWTKLYENNLRNVDTAKGLNLAAAISSELARLATIEMKSEIFGSERADYLNAQYQKVIDGARVFLEYACAKGGVILKPYIYKGKIGVGVVQADGFLVTSYTPEGEINGAVFYDVIHKNSKWYTRLEEHIIKADAYYIKNTAYESKSPDETGKEIPLSLVSEWEDIQPLSRIENLDKPLFAYLKMPAANTIDVNSPLGVSVFSRATDLIYDAYEQYSDLLWEFESGKRALFLDECAIRRDDEGGAMLPQKRLYRMLSTGNDELFEDWSPQIREESIISGLNRILRSIEFNCGLAYGTLSDTDYTDKTAEEIRASKQRSYSTICDIQKALKKSLITLIEAMDIYCDIYSLAPCGEYMVSFDFDDSIICDRNKEFDEKMMLLDKGVIAPWEMRSWYFDESEKAAREQIGEINEIQQRNNLAQN